MSKAPTATTALVAGYTLTKLGDITPTEQSWIQENSAQQQKMARAKKFKFVGKLAEQIGCTDYEALVIINTPQSQRTIEGASAIEWVLYQDEMNGEVDETPIDNDLEYLTYMVNSRLQADAEKVTYEDIVKSSEADKQALFDFVAAELGYQESESSTGDPVGENSADSSLPVSQTTPAAPVITG
jgi:hypothetical protein